MLVDQDYDTRVLDRRSRFALGLCSPLHHDRHHPLSLSLSLSLEYSLTHTASLGVDRAWKAGRGGNFLFSFLKKEEEKANRPMIDWATAWVGRLIDVPAFLK